MQPLPLYQSARDARTILKDTSPLLCAMAKEMATLQYTSCETMTLEVNAFLELLPIPPTPASANDIKVAALVDLVEHTYERMRLKLALNSQWMDCSTQEEAQTLQGHAEKMFLAVGKMITWLETARGKSITELEVQFSPPFPQDEFPQGPGPLAVAVYQPAPQLPRAVPLYPAAFHGLANFQPQPPTPVSAFHGLANFQPPTAVPGPLAMANYQPQQPPNDVSAPLALPPNVFPQPENNVINEEIVLEISSDDSDFQVVYERKPRRSKAATPIRGGRGGAVSTYSGNHAERDFAIPDSSDEEIDHQSSGGGGEGQVVACYTGIQNIDLGLD